MKSQVFFFFSPVVIKKRSAAAAEAKATSLDGDHKTPSLITLFLKATVQSNILRGDPRSSPPRGDEPFPPFSIMTCAKAKSRSPPLQRFYVSPNKNGSKRRCCRLAPQRELQNLQGLVSEIRRRKGEWVGGGGGEKKQNYAVSRGQKSSERRCGVAGRGSRDKKE